MSRISLNLSNNTIKLISAIAKENDATISEVSRYLLAKGLADYKNEELENIHQAIPLVETSKEAEL